MLKAPKAIMKLEKSSNIMKVYESIRDYTKVVQSSNSRSWRPFQKHSSTWMWALKHLPPSDWLRHPQMVMPCHGLLERLVQGHPLKRTLAVKLTETRKGVNLMKTECQMKQHQIKATGSNAARSFLVESISKLWICSSESADSSRAHSVLRHQCPTHLLMSQTKQAKDTMIKCMNAHLRCRGR